MICGQKIPLNYAHRWKYGIHSEHNECNDCGMKCDFTKNLTNVGTDVETYEWRDDSKGIGYRKYIMIGAFYDEHSPTGEGFYAINLADRSQNQIIMATPAAPKKKSRTKKS